jgi:hypothetical protein
LLSDRAAHRGIFEHKTVRDMVAVHKSGKTDLGHALWTLLTLELWMQRNFD